MTATTRKPRQIPPAPPATLVVPTELHLTRASFRRIVRELSEILDPLDRLIDHYEKFNPGANDQERCISVTARQRASLVVRCSTFEALRKGMGREAAGSRLALLPVLYRGHRLVVL